MEKSRESDGPSLIMIIAYQPNAYCWLFFFHLGEAVFAPIEVAFENFDMNIIVSTDALSNFILNHFVQGKYTLKDLEQGQKLVSLGGGEITINDETLQFIIEPDIEAKNGIVHAITAVLLSSSEEAIPLPSPSLPPSPPVSFPTRPTGPININITAPSSTKFPSKSSDDLGIGAATNTPTKFRGTKPQIIPSTDSPTE